MELAPTLALDVDDPRSASIYTRGKPVSYDDWVQIANDVISFELENDDRSIVLYGLSAGGMLAYHAAALNKKVKGIVGMTFLDQRIQQVRDETARNIA
ncbi:uncharacterized protein BDW43DRAFT_307629 [Aspergillus alliaceus]|uniref:uncharacterized protein n=1 Tax=Petromyces alliaceus TaxID=209559 RepID=UPI0012A74248|nr:uncharacterized protein BDW43DRAFT_307629 [Aspergillus alliaceus]KAB8237356.1 hypothetical protein BDW43DRAFT_307629 [Aspergillus alliaceus]